LRSAGGVWRIDAEEILKPPLCSAPAIFTGMISMKRILLGLAAVLLLTSAAIESAARRNCAFAAEGLSCLATLPLAP
jgi:hypothetical protein